LNPATSVASGRRQKIVPSSIGRLTLLVRRCDLDDKVRIADWIDF
jgi:hypothetical protein